MPTIPERVNAFITQHRQPACDTCIQKALGLSQHNQVQQINAALATTREFERAKGNCSICGKNVNVTKRVRS